MAHRMPAPKWLATFMLALSAGEESEIMEDLEFSVTSDLNVLFLTILFKPLKLKLCEKEELLKIPESIN